MCQLGPDTLNYHNAMAKCGLWSLVNFHLDYSYGFTIGHILPSGMVVFSGRALIFSTIL